MLHIPPELQPAIEGDNCSYLGQPFWSHASFCVSNFPPFFLAVHHSPAMEHWWCRILSYSALYYIFKSTLISQILASLCSIQPSEDTLLELLTLYSEKYETPKPY